jgi:hypothetical protein
MPILVNFIPCSLVILDAFTNSVSTMSIMDSIQPVGEMAPPPGDLADPELAEKPHFLVGPMTILSHWATEEADHGQQFEQCVLLRAPDGREAILQPPSAFVLERPFHRISHQAGLLTLRLAGSYQLRLQLRRSGEAEWMTIKEYPLLVQEVPREQALDQPTHMAPLAPA